MKILRTPKPGAATAKNGHSRYGRDMYMFIFEKGGFSAYVTDSCGMKWARVSRWVLANGQEGDNSGRIRVRPFSMREIISESKKAELQYIFSHILYNRPALSAHSTACAICEPFDKNSCGMLLLSNELPSEAILRDSYIAGYGPNGRSLSPVGEDEISQIMKHLAPVPERA